MFLVCDDILIFSQDLPSHQKHVKKILQRLREAGLQVDIDKCEFEVQRTTYLGFVIVAGKGLHMDLEKVEAIMSWDTPTSAKGVRGFLGFTNFYRKFINNFAMITFPLVELPKKDRKFEWTNDADHSFRRLMQIFTTALILLSFHPDRETKLETDASGHAIGGVLYQRDDKGVLLPCVFCSKRNSPAESNYPIFDEELWAIVHCLDGWDKELRSVGEFKVVTDHKNLLYFSSICRLSERHMRWMEIRNRFSFTIHYQSSKEF